MLRKPSLVRVAVFTFYSQCKDESKQMKSQRYRHEITSFWEGSSQNRPAMLCITLAQRKSLCKSHGIIFINPCQSLNFFQFILTFPPFFYIVDLPNFDETDGAVPAPARTEKSGGKLPDERGRINVQRVNSPAGSLHGV